MSRNRLELVREEKLFRLLPGRTEESRLEASGVALLDDATALVVFDNLNQVARIDLSLKRRRSNEFRPAPSLGTGFEDIAVDSRQGRGFCLVESVEDVDGHHRSFVAEYEAAGQFLGCAPLPTRLEDANKGCDGLEHGVRGGRERLYALHDGKQVAARQRGGRIDDFLPAVGGRWKTWRQIPLPKQVKFDDYAASAYRGGQLAIVSQPSARV